MMSHQTLQSRRQALVPNPASQDGTRVMLRTYSNSVSDAAEKRPKRVDDGVFGRAMRERFLRPLMTTLMIIIATSSSLMAQHQFPGNIDYTIPQDQYSIPDYSGSLNSQPTQGVGGFGVMGRAGHEAGDTIGRDGSISFLDLAPFSFAGNTMLFGDGRLFITNRGKMGGSVGMGLRQFFPEQNAVLGSTFYYDYDESRGVVFEQFTIATEVLTEFVDFRGNVHLPFGKKEQVTDVRFEPGTQMFVDATTAGGGVQGSNIQFQTRTFSAAALEGADLSLTTPIPGPFAEQFNLEATAGGYHYQARGLSQQKISGFKLRLDGDILDDLTHLSLEVTNDNVFNTNVVFGADINYWHHLDKKPRLGKSQYDRMASWVRRNRTVAASNSSVLDAPQLAINPDNDLPYLVYHVRNNPNPPPNNFPAPTGNGSEDMPFQFLQEGIDASPLADIVFVHANSVFDGAVDGNANATAVLREDVLVLGEGVPLTIPVVGIANEIDLPTVTPGATNRPIFQNVTGPVITMADNSRFAGFTIQDYSDGPAILANNVNGSELNELIINGSTGADGDGILIDSSSGTIVIENIAISDTSGNAFEVNNGNAAIAFNGTNSINNSSGHSVLIQDAAGSINMRSLMVMGDGGEGVLVTGTTPTSTTANITFDQVSLLNTNTARSGAFQIENFAGGATILNDVLIDSPLTGGITVDDLQAAGSVVFQGAVEINNRNEIGVLLSDIQEAPNPINPTNFQAGLVTFQDDLTITGLGAAASAAAAIDMESSTGTVFFRNIAIDGSNGVGIDLSQLDTVGSSTGSFLVDGLTSLENISASSINIRGNDSDNFVTIFNDVSINTRGSLGIFIESSASTQRFLGTTTIDNENDITESAIFIVQNPGDTNFNVVNVENAIGDFDLIDDVDMNMNPLFFSPSNGVNVVSNRNADDTEIAEISFNSLNVEFTGVAPPSAALALDYESAVSFGDNESVSVTTGIIEAEEARGIEVGIQDPSTEPLFHNIQLESVSATNENAGILVRNSVGRFIVTGQGDIAGSGGTITGMTGGAVQFINTQIGQVGYMDLEGNENGVLATDMLVEGAGLSPELILEGMNISDSNSFGITLDNVSDFMLIDSTLDDNGIPTNSPQIDILATVEETDIDLDGDDEDAVVYNILMVNNDISDSNTALAGNMINIRTGAGISDGADLNFLFQNNGVPGLAATMNSISSNRTGGSALSVVWEGDSDIVIDSNTFLLTNTNNQTGVILDIEGLANVAFTNNDVASNGVFDIGIDFNFEESANLIIGSNSVLDEDGNVVQGSGFQMTGDDSIAISLMFQSGGNNVNIFDNLINMGGVDSTGIEFNRIFAQSTVAINNNFIGLTTDFINGREEGIIFRDVRGVINLDGTQDNSIPLGTFFPDYLDFFIPVGTSNGQIIVNGTPRP